MTVFKKAVSVLLCVFMLIAFASCAKKPGNTNDDEFNIVASFYPMYIFTLNLIEGLDNVSLSCMAKQNTGCLHNYQLSTEDMKALSKADLFIINGNGMEPFVDDITKQLPTLKIVKASDNTKILFENHSYDLNSHVWLSPENAKIQVQNIASALKEALPNQSDKFSENESKYLLTLDSLTENEMKIKSQLQGVHVVSLHDAFSYIANDLGLVIDATIETDSEAEPGTQEITDIVNTMKYNGTYIILVPTEYSGNTGKILSNETGAKEVIIDPITSGEFTLTAYETAVTSNLKLISEAVN